MAKIPIIVKNQLISAQTLNDFGLAVPALGQVTLNETESIDEIYRSLDLKDRVTAVTVIINDGTDDLSIADGLAWLSYDAAADPIETPDIVTDEEIAMIIALGGF